jgi:hypothetical protein
MQPKAQPAVPTAAPDGGECDPPSKKYKKGDSAMLSTGASLLWQLPVVRIQGVVETLEPAFDGIATDGFDKETLCRIVWLLSGVKANLAVSSLRCQTYAVFNERMRVAQTRHIADVSDHRHKSILLALRPFTADRVTVLSDRCGFDMHWMQKLKKASAKTAAITAPPSTPAIADAFRTHAFDDDIMDPNAASSSDGVVATQTHRAAPVADRVAMQHSVDAIPEVVRQRMTASAPPPISDAASRIVATAPLTAGVASSHNPLALQEVVRQPGTVSATPPISDAQRARIDENRAICLQRRALPKAPLPAAVSFATTAVPVSAVVPPSPHAIGSPPQQHQSVALPLQSVALPAVSDAGPSSPTATTAAAGAITTAVGGIVPPATPPLTFAVPAAIDTEPGPPLPEECVICHQEIGPPEGRQRMLCTHTFHKVCINEYIAVTGKSFRHACPFKCFHDELAGGITVDDDEQGAEIAPPPQPDDTEGLLALARAFD